MKIKYEVRVLKIFVERLYIVFIDIKQEFWVDKYIYIKIFSYSCIIYIYNISYINKITYIVYFLQYIAAFII